jgi:hypothetical protein
MDLGSSSRRPPLRAPPAAGLSCVLHQLPRRRPSSWRPPPYLPGGAAFAVPEEGEAGGRGAPFTATPYACACAAMDLLCLSAIVVHGGDTGLLVDAMELRLNLGLH